MHKFSDVQQPKPQTQSNLPQEGKAEVTVISGKLIQAKLTEGNDPRSITLDVPTANINNRPRKKGEIVNVRIIYKGNKIEKLELK